LILRLAVTVSIMLVVLVVLGLGLQARREDASHLLRHPGLVLRSSLAMNVIMPLVGAARVTGFDPAAPVKVALAVSPVPPMLPSKELKAGGPEAHAISLVVVVALFAIVTVPISVTWLGSTFDRAGVVNPGQVAKVVLSSVLISLTVGIVCYHWLATLADRLARPLAMLGLGRWSSPRC